MDKRIFFLLAIIFLFAAASVQAQERNIRKGDEAYASGNFVEAAEQYTKALPELRQYAEPVMVQQLMFKIGDSYLQMNQYGKALPWMKDAVAMGIFSAEVYLRYAETLALNKKIKEAVAAYTTVWERTGNPVAKKKIATLKTYDDETPQFVNIRNQYGLNSKFSDYSPAKYGNKVVFSSARPGKNDQKNNRTSQSYSDLYLAAYNSRSQSWGSVSLFNDIFNTRKSEGVFTYSQATGKAYWMQCMESNVDCRLMMSESGTDGRWKKPKEINPAGSQPIGHPAIGDKGVTLYFVSDMPGGFGGKDIWKVNRIDGGMWGMPINLGASVNTEFDELFPSVSGDTLLLFASNRPESYGGLDIYVSEIKGEQVLQPLHPGYPFNTVRDDFGVLLLENGGLLTSNRNNIAQSDDIFAFDGFPDVVYVQGTVMDKETMEPVSGATLNLAFENHSGKLKSGEKGGFLFRVAKGLPFDVEIKYEGYRPFKAGISNKMLDAIASGDTLNRNFLLVAGQPLAAIEGTVTMRETGNAMPGETVELFRGDTKEASVKTNKKGIYQFESVLPDMSYQIKVSKEGFFSESRRIVIPTLASPATFNKATGYDTDFELTRIQKEKEVVINNIFYDFNKATLRPESKKELNKLVSMLKETPNVIIQINSHTDSRGSDSYNQRLSQRRAQRVVDYLARNGISPDRLFARGYGEKRLLVKNASTETEHQLNRRTAFKVLAVLAEKSSPTPEPGIAAEFNSGARQKGEQGSTEKRASTNNLSYRVQVMVTSKRLEEDSFRKLVTGIPNVRLFREKSGGVFKYQIGERPTYQGAVELRRQVVALGQKDCFIKAYHRGEKVSVKEALKIEQQ